MTENVKVSDRLSVRVENRNFLGARRDLTLNMGEVSKGIWGEIEYDVDLFFESTITTLLQNILSLLHGIVNNPDIDISEGLEKKIWLDGTLIK